MRRERERERERGVAGPTSFRLLYLHVRCLWVIPYVIIPVVLFLEDGIEMNPNSVEHFPSDMQCIYHIQQC